MNRRVKRSWRGLYALLPTTMALLYMAGTVKVTEVLRQVLLVAVGIVISLLALSWVEKHHDLVASEGVDAQAEEDLLRVLGVDPTRLAASLTARQAHYRRVMLTRTVGESLDGEREKR